MYSLKYLTNSVALCSGVFLYLLYRKYRGVFLFSRKMFFLFFYNVVKVFNMKIRVKGRRSPRWENGVGRGRKNTSRWSDVM